MSLAEPIGSMVELSINFCYNCLDQITLFLVNLVRETHYLQSTI